MRITIAIFAALVLTCFSKPISSSVGARHVFAAEANEKTYTAADYVQDGLICMWDAIENAGWKTHSPDASAWMNLADGRQFNIIKNTDSDYAWTDVSFVRTAVSYGYFLADYTDELQQPVRDGTFTFEIVTSSPVQSSNWQTQVINICQAKDVSLYSRAICCLYRREDNGRIDCPSLSTYWASNMFAGYYAPTREALVTAAISLDGKNMYCYANGELIRPPSFTPNQDLEGIIVRLGSTAYGFRGSYHCLRVYNRPLSASEIKKNYKIDKERFGL